MLTYKECLDMSELTDDEIAAIAAHEHVPEIVAAELGNYLVNCSGGVPQIKQIILDDIRSARQQGRSQRVNDLELVLQHFIASHSGDQK